MEALKKAKLSYVIEAAITILIGVALIVWTGSSIRIVARVLAALLAIFGIVTVVNYFVRKERTVLSSAGFTIGILVAAVGGWIFFNPDTFTDFIPKLFGIFLLASGLMNLGQTLSLIQYKYSNWAVSLVTAAVTVGMGVFLIVEPRFAKEFVVTIIGVFLVVDGATNLLNTLMLGKASKKVEKDKNKPEVVDAEAVVIEEKK